MLNRVYIGVVALLIGATATVAILQVTGSDGSVPDPAITADDTEYNVTEDGTKYVVNPDELLQGCSGMDCIPSIDDPSFVSASEADAWLAAEDVVMGVEINGDVRAYPLRILERHEIVNDVVGGEPVAVTYCPLCRSGVVHSRVVDGETLEFGVSGQLRNANLVMYDRKTETYWSQIGGRAIIGEMVPAQLELLHASVTRWEDWREGHPDTDVLSRETGIYPASSYNELLYEQYHSSPSVGFGVDEPSGDLASKEVVYGVNTGQETKAYPEVIVRNETVINDRVGDVPVLVFVSPEDGGIRAFERRIDGEELRFELEEGRLVDQDGTAWSVDGVAQEGPLEGRQLERHRTDGFYWFAWEKFNEGTEIYRGE